MQRLIDNVLGVVKESLKAFSQECFNNTVKLINGISALILTFLPGKAKILEGVRGWELRPTWRTPDLPHWMEEGVSSFNKFIHEYTADSGTESDSEYESGLEDNDSIVPSSPSSQSSQLSKAGSFFERGEHPRLFKLGALLCRVRNCLRYLLGIGFWGHWEFSRRSDSYVPRHTNSSGSLSLMYGLATKGWSNVMDSVVHRTTDRRRGIIEDLQMGVELCIERMFDVVHRIVLSGLSPLQTLKVITRNIYQARKVKRGVEVQTSKLGDSDPPYSIRKTRLTQTMNTDARSCEDVITELGYPYEAIQVVTDDGYLLLMERIPRRDSEKVLYLQHGVLDSSLGWVSSGVVGSQAFAAYDQGFDVFLGNFRGLASREHIDKNISSRRYWSYSINEHGVQDIPAMVNKIHAIKMQELHVVLGPFAKSTAQPYTLCGVAHSLGGAALLMYVVTRRLEGKPHRLSRLILLSPAGFHEEAPFMCTIMQYVFPALAPILAPVLPGLYIRTKIFRAFFNKLARDFQNYPAVGGLVQTLCSYVVGGDSSNWIEALGQTHYNMYDMPGVAYRVILHFAQMRRANRFQMYDYGIPSANIAVYGTPYPVDIGANYGVIDIPIDLVGGRKDKLIPRTNVRRHYQILKEKGCQASYNEFEYAHLDFTFAHREELLAYVMSKLSLVVLPKTSVTPGRGRRSKDNAAQSSSRSGARRLQAVRTREKGASRKLHDGETGFSQYLSNSGDEGRAAARSVHGSELGPALSLLDDEVCYATNHDNGYVSGTKVACSDTENEFYNWNCVNKGESGTSYLPSDGNGEAFKNMDDGESGYAPSFNDKDCYNVNHDDKVAKLNAFKNEGKIDYSFMNGVDPLHEPRFPLKNDYGNGHHALPTAASPTEDGCCTSINGNRPQKATSCINNMN